MLYGPDCSSDEGLSDDNDYYEFKERLRKNRQTELKSDIDSEAEQKKKQLQSVFSAISYGNEDVVFNELDKGLDVNVDLEFGWTPLLLAATVGNKTIIFELLKRGADVNQSRDGSTALMLLCDNRVENETSEENILASIKLLLDNGANYNATDRKRRTALMLAAYNGHMEVVKLLLPLTDKETEDNQRWTALFWAVEGNKAEIVHLLLTEGFNSEKIDIRGNSVTDIAHSNGFEDILKLLPQDPFNEEFHIHLNNNQLNFEATFSKLEKHEKPQFFVDVCKILYGTKSESVVSILRDKNISLFDFLSVSDSKLKNFGIQLPYQRNRIIGGLFKFHKHPFQPKSIPFIRKNELYTNIDISSTVLSCIKQLIAMEAGLRFIAENFEDKLTVSESQEIEVLLVKTRQQIRRLKIVTKQFLETTKRWDSTLTPADLITRKRRNFPWCHLFFSIGLVSLVFFFKIK